MLTSEQKLLCALSHLSMFFAPILAPLIVLLVSDDKFVKMQAKEALGFHIFLTIAGVISTILMIVLIGIPLAIILGLMAVILPIIAFIKVIDSIDYSYPITGNFIRKNF